MKLAFTIHWYDGVSADIPTTHETYIANIPDDLLPAEVRRQLHDKLRQQSIFLGNYKLLLHSKIGFDKDPTETLRHNKYKRCLFMVEYYRQEVRYTKDYMSRCGGYDSYVNARINKLKKRLAIWTKLMNKFKEPGDEC